MADVGNSQRDAIKQISPPWLTDGFAEKFLYNIGLSADAVLEKLNQAVQARLPGRCDASALPILGADRVMPQGPSETNDNYALRLQKAFDAWQHAGSRRSVLQQALTYVANASNVSSSQVPIGAIVGTTSAGTYATWDVFYNTSDTTKPPHHQLVGPANWNWDGQYLPHRAWLVLYFPIVLSTTGAAASVTALSGGFATLTGLSGMSSGSVGKFLVVTGAASSGNNGTFQISQFISSSSVKIANPSAVAGDANNGAIAWTLGTYPAIGPAPAIGTPGVTIGGNANISIGLSVASGYITGLRNLVRLWKSADTFYPWIIVSFAGADGTTGKEFSPNSSIGSGNPDGTWGTWAKTSSGVSVPSRSTGVSPGKFDAFCDGTAIYQQCWTPTGT